MAIINVFIFILVSSIVSLLWATKSNENKPFGAKRYCYIGLGIGSVLGVLLHIMCKTDFRSSSAQYVYPYGTCITIGFSYENKLFKGYDHFAFFGKEYDKLIKLLESIDKTLDGQICLYDVGGDTDGYIDITCKNGK